MEIPILVAVLLIVIAIAAVCTKHFDTRGADESSIFVRGITTDQLEMLNHDSIPFTFARTGQGADGIMFSARSFGKIKRLLKAEVLEIFPNNEISPSPPGGVNEAVLNFKTPIDPELQRLKTIIVGTCPWYDLRRRLQLRSLRRLVHQMFMPHLRKPIFVHVGEWGARYTFDYEFQRCAPFGSHDEFHIFVDAIESGSRRVAPPKQVMGMPYEGSSTCTASGTGLPIRLPGTDYIAAELLSNNACLYLPVFDDGRLREGLFFRLLQLVEAELLPEKYLEGLVADVKADDDAGCAEFEVRCDGLVGRRQEVLSFLVRKILTREVRSNITIRDCAGTNASPVFDEDFHIFLYSSPVGSPFLEAPEKVWGHRLLKQETVFAPSGLGTPLIDDNGHIVGELIGRNLFLHQTYVNFGARSEASLFSRLLKEVRNYRGLDADQTTIANMVTGHFVDECLRQITLEKGSLVSTSDVSKAKSSFLEQLHGLLHEELDLLQLKSAPDEEIGREFDELTNFPNVVSVDVEGSTIVVTTNNLYCVHPSTRVKYDIGAFKIKIYTDSNSIRWFNQTRLVNGGNQRMNAPHVNSDGNPCFGNTAEAFPRLIKKRELTSVVQLAIAFVESVNLDDSWGKHIEKWPRAT